MKSLLLLLSLLIATLGFAKIPEPQKNTYVNDYAHVLSKKQIKMLNERIRKFENKTTVQLSVILIKTVPAEYNFDDYALLVSRKWRAKATNNDMLYVLAIEPSLQKLEITKSLQSFISPSDNELILQSIESDVEHVHYASAIYNLTEETEKAIANVGSYSATVNNAAKSNEQPEEKYTEPEEDHTTAITVLSLYSIYLVIVYFYQKKHPSPFTLTPGIARNIGRFIRSVSRK